MEKSTFQKIGPEEIEGNLFDAIGRQWMLVTGGDSHAFNMMTASWGAEGVLWNKPVVILFIRPQRYTREFLEEGSCFTCGFFGEEYRDALSYCGKYSGRDCDKVKETGLTPAVHDSGAVYFQEAEQVLVCRKLYTGALSPEGFAHPDLKQYYPDADYHSVYIGEIIDVLKK